jgi:hypothetical protein
MIKMDKMKSVQYMYSISRKIKMNGRLVNVYLENCNEQLFAFGNCEPMLTWSRNKNVATLVSPIMASRIVSLIENKGNYQLLKYTFEL